MSLFGAGSAFKQHRKHFLELAILISVFINYTCVQSKSEKFDCKSSF